MSKYIRFEQIPTPGLKTKKIVVINDSGNYPLGFIRWNVSWRQYVFESSRDTIFNHECLHSILEKVKTLNWIQRNGE